LFQSSIYVPETETWWIGGRLGGAWSDVGKQTTGRDTINTPFLDTYLIHLFA